MSDGKVKCFLREINGPLYETFMTQKQINSATYFQASEFHENCQVITVNPFLIAAIRLGKS